MDPPPLSLPGTTTLTPSISLADGHPRPPVGRNIQFPLSLPRDPPREAAHASAAVREKFQKVEYLVARLLIRRLLRPFRPQRGLDRRLFLTLAGLHRNQDWIIRQLTLRGSTIQRKSR